jgi:hypothetical protein
MNCAHAAPFGLVSLGAIAQRANLPAQENR